jgi:hypothetical protein
LIKEISNAIHSSSGVPQIWIYPTITWFQVKFQEKTVYLHLTIILHKKTI